MARIKRSLTIVLAILTVTSVALVIVPLSTGVASLPDKMTVPVGRVGDVVGYAQAYKYTDPTLEDTPSTRTYAGNGTDGFHVMGYADVRDEAGHARRALQVATARGSDGAWGQDVGPREYIDASSRALVRFDLELGEHQAFFGPTTSWWYEGFHHEAFALQGQTLRVGEDLTERVPSKRFQFEMWDVESFEERVWVSEIMMVDGEPGWVVEHVLRVVGSYGAPTVRESWVQHGRDIMTRSAPYPRVSIVEYTEAWWDPAEPSKMLSSSRVVAEEHLALYEVGEGPQIAWDPWKRESERPGPVDLERSGPGAHHPTDGRSSPWSFRLDAALQSVQNDPTLTDFASWRAEHPDALLVGAKYYGPQAVGTAERWDLIYGSAPDALFALRSRDTPLEIPVNEEVGAFVARPELRFSLDDLPLDPVTFAAAAGVSKVFGASQEDSFAQVGWGYHWYASDTPTETPPGGRAGENPHQWLDRIFVRSADQRVLIEATTGHAISSLSRDVPMYVSDQPMGPKPAVHAIPELAGFTHDIRPFAATTAWLTGIALLATMIWSAQGAVGSSLLAPGFTRLHSDKLLRHPLRRRIYRELVARPGASATDVFHATRAPWSTVIHHLRQLERHGTVVSLVDGRHKRFFISSVAPGDREQTAALGNATTQAVLKEIERRPGVHQQALAAAFQMTSQGVVWHIRRLERAGLVQRGRDGRHVRHYATLLQDDTRPPSTSARAAVPS